MFMMCLFNLILSTLTFSYFFYISIPIISTMEGMFEDGIEEFITYERDDETKKTRR